MHLSVESMPALIRLIVYSSVGFCLGTIFGKIYLSHSIDPVVDTTSPPIEKHIEVVPEEDCDSSYPTLCISICSPDLDCSDRLF